MVRWPYRVHIEGELVEEIDGAVYVAGLSCLVEAKDTAAQVDVSFLAKLRNQLGRRPAATVGLFFSRSGFTDAALTLVTYFAPQTVLLWDEDDISYVLERESIVDALETKYRSAVENGPAYRRLKSAGAR